MKRIAIALLTFFVLSTSAPVWAQPVGVTPPAQTMADAGGLDSVEKPSTITPTLPKEDPKPEKPAAEVEENPITLISQLIEAAEKKAWPVVIGLVLMLLIAVSRRFDLLRKLPEDKIPYAALALGVLANVALALVNGTPTIWVALAEGLLSGLSAIGLWEAAGSKFGFLKKD